MADLLSPLSAALSSRWADLWDVVINPKPDAAGDETVRAEAERLAPVVWMLGKVQAGKTSIVKALTRASEAEIGAGYRACTKASRIWDFPAEAPVIRFLDTRGLGEAGYDPAEDLAVLEGHAHLVMAVMRALDPQQEAVLAALTTVRRRHPDWPVIVAQTALHEGYPLGMGHVQPYPFDGAGQWVAATAVPQDVQRSLEYQRGLFARLPGSGAISFVPIDFTQAGDGFEPTDYGIDPLLSAIERAAPAALHAAVADVHGSHGDRLADRAHPHILGYATAAAAADLVPVAGLVAVPTVQAKMLHSLAGIAGAAWDRRTLSEFAGCLGTGTIIRLLSAFGARELAKLIPIYGQTAGAAAAAAASFASTYALGKAALYFLARRGAGAVASEAVAETYRAAFREAFGLARDRALGARPGASPT